MVPGGELRIATDIPGYVRWTLLHVRSHGGFAWGAERAADWRHRPADWPPTRYEAKAIAAGRRPTYLWFARRPWPLRPCTLRLRLYKQRKNSFST